METTQWPGPLLPGVQISAGKTQSTSWPRASLLGSEALGEDAGPQDAGSGPAPCSPAPLPTREGPACWLVLTPPSGRGCKGVPRPGLQALWAHHPHPSAGMSISPDHHLVWQPQAGWPCHPQPGGLSLGPEGGHLRDRLQVTQSPCWVNAPAKPGLVTQARSHG